MLRMPFGARGALRRRERGQSALAECAILLPTYVVLIFACQTFGQMGQLKKKAIISARYQAFGGDKEDAYKVMQLEAWEKVEFGEQKVKLSEDKNPSKIMYNPMMIMRKASGGNSEKNPLDIRGGIEVSGDEGLELSDTYAVDL